MLGCNGAAGTVSTSTAAREPDARSSRLIARNLNNARHLVVVGSKDFPEARVLGEIYAQTLHAAGYNVHRRLGLANEGVAFRALTRGSIDAYPEYTGIILNGFYGYSPGGIPKNAGKAFAAARRRLRADGVTPLPQARVNDTQAVVVTPGLAEKTGNLRTISDLARTGSRFVAAGHPACEREPLCFRAVKRRYHVKFKRFRASNPPYKALDQGAADVAFAFTTDPELSSGDYVALFDDKHLFAPYRVTLLFRSRLLARLGPDARRAVADVQKPLTTETMRRLNARVIFDNETPRSVARAFLKEEGFVK